MRTRILMILSASAVCIGGLAFLAGTSKEPESLGTSEVQAENLNEAKVAEKMIETKPGSSVSAAPAVVVAPHPEVTKVWKDFAHVEELQTFGHLQQKAMLLPADKIEKARLMRDERFLASLEPLLKVAPVDAESSTLQNQALDFVFEALNSEMRAGAIAILKNVVADPGVENTAGDMTERSQMAGVKAEAMFNLASAEPTAKNEIESLLPGPVSKNIWDNVQQRQESNLAESAGFQVSK